jgi:dTDP-4-dehydrorhamnose reductase
MAAPHRLLVIGGSGFIGARIVAAAAARGCRAAYTYARRSLELPAVAYRVDLAGTADQTLETCVADVKPQTVIYCAVPQTHADWDVHHVVSVEGVKRTLDVLRDAAPTALFIYVSTDAVFGGGNGPYCESDAPEPELRRDAYRAYSLTKAAGEQVAREEWPNSIVARTATVNGYAVDGTLSRRIAELAAQLRRQRPLQRFGDRYISPTLLETLDPAFRYRGVLHMAGSQRVTDYEFTRCLARRLGVDESLIEVNYPAASGGALAAASRGRPVKAP